MSDDPKDDKIKRKQNTAGFLGDLTDDREKGDWQSRYSGEVHRHIHWEKRYLILLFFLSLSIPCILGILCTVYPEIASPNFQNLKKYVFGFSGGVLGGTLFAIKWLVHGVAKGSWTIDRQLWRIFTPLLSGGLAMVIVILINCQMFSIVKPENLSIHKSFGIGFLVGYFSDNAIGKLTEIAQVLFGSTLSKGK